MNCYVALEPDYESKSWCLQCLQGVKRDIARSSGNFVEISVSDEAVLREIAHEARPLTIVIGSLLDWTKQTIAKLDKFGIHCIIPASGAQGTFSCVSSVTVDYTDAVYTFCDYLLSIGRPRVALVGIYQDSLNDLNKLNAFLAFMRERLHRNAEQDVFRTVGTLRIPCDDFCQRYEEYDAVLCSNDVVALYLMERLRAKQVSIPEQLSLIGLSERTFSRFVQPGITSVSPDFIEIGKNTVRIYKLLRRSSGIKSIQAQVQGIINCRASSGNMPFHRAIPNSHCDLIPQPDDFYGDVDAQPIFALDTLLTHCEPLDFDILKGLEEGQYYAQMADQLFTTEYTIKYRVKRMQDLAQVKTRDELIALLKRYEYLF